MENELLFDPGMTRDRRRQTRCLTRLDLVTRGLVACGCVALVSGCTLFSKSIPETFALGDKNGSEPTEASISERAGAAVDAARVSNPPAQQIRFEGQEKLLGGGTCQALPPNELATQLGELNKQKKYRSASMLAQLHKRSARQLLLSQPTRTARPTADLIAAVLDQGSSVPNWQSFLAECKTEPDAAAKWQSAVSAFQASGGASEDAQAKVSEVVDLSSGFESPLLQVEAMRMQGQHQVAAGNTQQAIESLVSAAELAAGNGLSDLASDLWLMTCEASLRMDQVDQARQCWLAAVTSQLASMHARGAGQLLPTIDSVFWEHAVRLAHPGDELPKELTVTLAPWYSRIGIQLNDSLAPEAALWSAIAEFQLATGQPHLAALSIKRAETDSPDAARPFLQIALARAMADQGQHAVATTILGALTESEDPNVRASSQAALGSIKVQSGAYEQGGRFLVSALSVEDATDWPGRLAAQADLANTRLILGKLDDVLPVMHAVQTEMLKAGKWQSLCYSLANEAAILEFDGRKREAKAIHKRIESIERQSVVD